MKVCYEHGDLEKKKKCKSKECLDGKDHLLLLEKYLI